MKYKVKEVFNSSYTVWQMSKYLGVSRSGYYKYRKRDKEEERGVYEKIKEIQERVKYGYRRIEIEMEKKYAVKINHKKVLRIMRRYDLLSRIRRRYIYIKTGEILHKYENIYKREFKAEEINKKWTTDISYIITPKGRLYLSVVRDIYDGYIVAYKYSTRQDMNLVIATIREALESVKRGKTILHSDQGFQYTSGIYNKMVKENGIIPKGSPLDNAPSESFFSAFKSGCIYLEKPKTKEEAKQMTDEYIDFYNFQRIQLKYKATPYEIRQKQIAQPKHID